MPLYICSVVTVPRLSEIQWSLAFPWVIFSLLLWTLIALLEYQDGRP